MQIYAKKDIFHETVKIALQKGGWKITADPLFISTKNNINFFIDLGLEGVIGAEKEGTQIAVEIKSFDTESAFYSFYEILGQYLVYRMALDLQPQKVELFIALSNEGFMKLEDAPIFSDAMKKYNLNIIIFEPITQTIIEWKK